jgi:hypothetical protein
MAKNKAWFVKTRGSYLPCSWQGWFTYVPFIAYLLGSFGYDDISGHCSYGNLLYTMIPQWIVATVVMTWIAKHKS